MTRTPRFQTSVRLVIATLGMDATPRAITANGHPLTSAEAIESAADAGLVVPINLGPDAVIVGTLSGR